MEGYSWGMQKDTKSPRRNLKKVRSLEARRSKKGIEKRVCCEIQQSGDRKEKSNPLRI